MIEEGKKARKAKSVPKDDIENIILDSPTDILKTGKPIKQTKAMKKTEPIEEVALPLEKEDLSIYTITKAEEILVAKRNKPIRVKEKPLSPLEEPMDTPKEETTQRNKPIKVKTKPAEETVEVGISDEPASPKRDARIRKTKMLNELFESSSLPKVEIEATDEEGKPVIKKKEPRVSKKERIRQGIENEKRLIENPMATVVQITKYKRRETRIIRYNTNPSTGLSTEIIEHRILQGLTNTKPTGSTKSVTQIFLGNIFTFFNLMTVMIAAWLITIGSFKDIFFMVIVLLNNGLGIYQELKAKRIIDKLSLLSAHTALILRDGDEYEIPIGEIVLDDILVLTTGKQITSDALVVDGMIEVNEALLTGESDAIQKKIGDMLYSGSYVVSGRCKARVDRCGKENYMDKLTSQAKKYRKPSSDLMRTLTWIIRIVGIIIIPLAVGVFIRMRQDGGFTYYETVRSTAGAMIGMIPSGLFLLTSIALFVGVIRLYENETLVQDLYCIEMLARVDVLCLDKTGTITDGSMTVRNLIEYNNSAGITIKNAVSAMLNALNESNLTSKALEEKFGRGKRIKHKATIPFNSSRKFSAVEFERYGTFLLGAPEFILSDKYYQVAADVDRSALEGYRVLGIAHSTGSIIDNRVTESVSPIGLILIEDTVRPDCIETINYFKESGVEIRVISGDNPLTVSKISERAGITDAQNYISLENLNDKEVLRAASKYVVFGRVSPHQKKLLITALKDMGKTVAMTGDGVNDILALREADCSIALASGSEAARNVSHLVLMDSNFNSMPKVVAEGRRVINNVQKVSSLFLTKTIFSFLLAIIALFICRYPIKTSQLMMIDFFVIGIPSFALAIEPNNNRVTGKFLTNVFRNAIPGAIVILISTLIVFGMGSEQILNMSDMEMSTLIVVNATFTCFMVLLNVCRPMNILRRFLFAIMSSFAIAVTFLIPDFFDFVPLVGISRLNIPALRVECLLLLLVLVQATYPGIIISQNIVPWIKKVIKKLLLLVNKI